MHLVAPPALYPAKCGQAQTVLWGKNTPLLSYSFDKYQGNANAEKRQSEAGHSNSLTSEEAKLLGSRTLLGALGLTTRSKDATRNKCHATRNKCLTGSNKKLVETSALILGARMLLGAFPRARAPVGVRGRY